MTLPEWTTLFGAGKATRAFRLLSRRGEPLLVLPQRASAAAHCLQMYPAQTMLARAARVLASFAMRIPGCPWPKRISLPWDGTSVLSQFLQSLTAHAPVEFGALLGNPRAGGRRWVLLVFENDGPRWVVKVGASPHAQTLIATEHAALAALPPDLPGKPTGMQLFVHGGISALVMDFVRGCSPPLRGVDEQIGKFLGAWLSDGASQQLADSPVWQAVARIAPAEAARLERAFGAAPFCSTFFHGDLAPWNLRASGGRWTAIDWERGEVRGLPGWDWFHYVVQTRILVEKRSARETLAELEALFTHAAWQTYARKAEIAGRERTLLAGYLLWADEVIRPSEGREALREMRALLPPA